MLANEIEGESHMSRFMKSCVLAFFAVVALGAVAATALATPEFKGNKPDIHFTGHSLLTVLKGETAGAEGTITCHKDLIEGLILVPSMLVDKLLVKFHTNCEEVIPALKEEKKCEPVLTKPLMGTLGFLNKAAVPVGMLLVPETGTEFASTECEGTKTTVGGELVGEYPETNPFTRANQYNKDLTEYAFVLQASGTAQHWTTFELLGSSFMEKVELKTEGFLGGKASEEGTELLELPEAGLIET
jgi:hypothetical protein